MLAAEAEGQQILTVEGLAADGQLHPVQAAFVANGGLQCGFCTSGMMMSTVALLKRSPQPTELKFASAWQVISVAALAITRLSKLYRTQQRYYTMSERNQIGKAIPRLDSVDKVTGLGTFAADIRLPGMLIGKFLGQSPSSRRDSKH